MYVSSISKVAFMCLNKDEINLTYVASRCDKFCSISEKIDFPMLVAYWYHATLFEEISIFVYFFANGANKLLFP